MMNFGVAKKVRITLTEEALGMMPADPEIYRKYIASKAEDAKKIEEEVAEHGVDEVMEKTLTVFPRLEDGTPFFWDYQIRGFFKDALGMLRRAPRTEASKIKNYKKIVDGLIMVEERKIPIHLSGRMGTCQRPLRAQTPQGERVALAYSETVPAGSSIEFTVRLLDPDLLRAVTECLEYGRMRGLAQWRNSGKGTFKYEYLD